LLIMVFSYRAGGVPAVVHQAGAAGGTRSTPGGTGSSDQEHGYVEPGTYIDFHRYLAIFALIVE
jgi:hypothetical protein